jgi:hypothetical protein
MAPHRGTEMKKVLFRPRSLNRQLVVMSRKLSTLLIVSLRNSIMIKASEGGREKVIRFVENEKDLKLLTFKFKNEVIGSPTFDAAL